MACEDTRRIQVTVDATIVAPECGDVFLPYGTDNTLEPVIRDADGKAVDITGDTVTLTVKDGRGGTQIFQKSNGPGAHADPTQGRTDFAIAAADIASADPFSTTVWRYEIRRTAAGGDVSAHLAGLFIVEPTI